MGYRIVVLPGDGIGPEVTEAAIEVMHALHLRLDLIFAEAGAHCIPQYGTNLPKETLSLLKGTNACLKGPMTTLEEAGQPASVAVQLRKHLNLYANIRPCKGNGMDMIVVRENTEGLYSGRERKIPGGALAERVITRRASTRVAKKAFLLAQKRRKHLTYVHKANILRLTDGVFIDAVLSVGKHFSHVRTESMHVDAAAMQLVKNPAQFDILLTTNLFGDILSDEAAQVAGGLGTAASANVGDTYGMFEPVHGSVPKYAGKGIANPFAMIRAVSMMLDFLGEQKAAARVERALEKAAKSQKRTRDIGGRGSTREATEEVVRWL